jgi:hypothetical protein
MESYDWYEFSFTDEKNKTVEGYIYMVWEVNLRNQARIFMP